MKHEKNVARLTDGYVTPNSGAGRLKGDVQAKDFKVECKSTSKGSLTLHLKWLHKIFRESFADRKTPILSIEFGEERYYCLREVDFKEYLEVIKNAKKEESF